MAVRRSMTAMLCLAALSVACSRPAEVDNGTHLAVTENATIERPTPSANEKATASVPSAPVATENSIEPGTQGGDGSQIVLDALSAADMEGAKLEGELACSFSGGDATLLLARGDVGSSERSQGVVKVANSVEAISAAGGYDAMIKGVRFEGQGKTITIAVTGKAHGAGESPAYPATLTYDRPDGARRNLIGDWTCGP
jgi:hypothetical protein